MLKKCMIAVVGVFLLSVSGHAYQDLSNVEIQTIQVTPHIHMLMGYGGNIGVSTGENGVFLIDDQMAPLTQKILAAVSKLSDKPVKFLVNTHWHFDHTGGNENLGKGGAVIVAHENVRKRLAAGQSVDILEMVIPPAPPQALPVVTFPDSLTFHWNNDTIEVIHFPGGHTDGDSVIFFKSANVIHTGDLFFNRNYPFIDAQSGGSMKGMIRNVERILKRVDRKTKIIPGHGPLADRADLEAYITMLRDVHDRISAMKRRGMSLEKVIAAKPSKAYDQVWGRGFLSPDKWVEVAYSAVE